MCIDKMVNAMAGTLILLSLGLGVQSSPIFQVRHANVCTVSGKDNSAMQW